MKGRLSISKFTLALAGMLVSALSLSAQEPDLTGQYPTRGTRAQSSLVSPAFFGPNAFQIPDMLDGTTSDKLKIELSGEYFMHSATTRLTGAGYGAMQGWTAGINGKITIPLWTDRVNLVIWIPLEWYDDGTYRGFEAGDAYVSTDIHVLKERKWAPDITIRAALKSASGGSYEKRRYYDDPGYFFDATIAKSWKLDRKCPFFDDIRLAASGGFLCWQTGDGRQNDAFMYGLQAKLRTKYFAVSETWGGYFGWMKCGDAPMSLKTQVNGRIKDFEPFFLYQWGICDWPFHQFRLGLIYNIDILRFKKQE